MSDEDKKESEEEAPKSSMVRDLAIGVISLVFGVGTGAVVPMFMSPAQEAEPGINEQVEKEDPKPEPMDIPEAEEEVAFIEFDELVVNLNDERYTRFLTCKFSLQVAESQKAAIEELVTKKSVMLKNWIISHLREKELESVKGMLGQNTLRREIHDEFNQILFTDGIERIQDVLFEDLKVQ